VSSLQKNENTNAKTNKPNRSQKHCDNHRKCNHTTAHCKVIKKHCKDNQTKNNATDKNMKDKNNEQPKYNTGANKQKEENNVISKQPNNDASNTNAQ
jgi:hypothetical protein